GRAAVNASRTQCLGPDGPDYTPAPGPRRERLHSGRGPRRGAAPAGPPRACSPIPAGSRHAAYSRAAARAPGPRMQETDPRSAPAALPPLRNRTFDEIAVGDRASLQRTLTAEDIQLFAVMSGDFNPTHVDHEFAASSDLSGVIAHGMWGAALISALLGTRLPGPGTLYLGQTLKFRAPVRIGDTLDVTVTVTARDPSSHRLTLRCTCV